MPHATAQHGLAMCKNSLAPVTNYGDAVHSEPSDRMYLQGITARA